MKKKLISAAILLGLGLLVTGTAYGLTKASFLLSLAITLGTFFYHFAMRLLVGYVMDSIFHNQIDCTGKWFRERSFEPGLYRKLRVKNWKKHIPSYAPENFSLGRHSIEEIVGATCQAEVVHEVIVVLSFVPILFSVWFGVPGVFIATSCAAALLDSVFVILQRYNRPRLVRLMERKRTQ